MPSIEHVESRTLELPPSCVEFWPCNSRYAIIGTYNLERQEPQDGREQGRSQSRNGSLILVQVEEHHVTPVQTLKTPSAVLDIHFGRQYLGVATSTGSIGLYELGDVNKPAVRHVRTIQYFSEDVLVTAFSWHPTSSTTVAMTLTDGRVSLGDIETGTSLDVTTHDLEAWTLAFLPDGSGLYSGGDDSALRFTGETQSQAECSKMPWSDQKTHGAGVVAILPLHTDQNSALVLTGSYDDRIRLLRIPDVGRRVVLAEMDIGGGVWRLKRIDTAAESDEGENEVTLLASCMHAGARILRLIKDDNQHWHFEVLARFEEHQSMNYGSDVQEGLNERGQRTFLSTSFYDRLLCLWRW